jgi:hypothetical protein
MRFRTLFFRALATLLLGHSTRASVTEIRADFFEQTADLQPSPILSSAPTDDGSYLISLYETAGSAAPTLQWTDENGVLQTQTVVARGTYYSLVQLIRVQAGTMPTVSTSGFAGQPFSLYVDGLGFWPKGTQGQHGLKKFDGFGSAKIHMATSTSALLLAISTGPAVASIPYVTWYENDELKTLQVPANTSIVQPIRADADTVVWIQTYAGDSMWYGLITFGIPAAGAGPFKDYETNLLEWTDATYPDLQTAFTAGASGAQILMASNIAEQPNAGSVAEQLYMPGGYGGGVIPCLSDQTAPPSGVPAPCVSPIPLGANGVLQFGTENQSGGSNLWGGSPLYSAEVDVLEF